MIHGSIHDCASFGAWLDGGMDTALAAAANAHAAGCARCAAALELEALLAAPPVVRAGAAFTEGVLFRVRDAERAHAAARFVLADTEQPWWLRAPAEPSAALALAAAALLAWRGDGLWAFAVALAARAEAHDWARGPGSNTLDALGHAVLGFPSGTLASGALLAVLLLVVGLASLAIYRGIEQLVASACSRPANGWLRAAPRP
jgi:hypothetical protein